MFKKDDSLQALTRFVRDNTPKETPRKYTPWQPPPPRADRNFAAAFDGSGVTGFEVT